MLSTSSSARENPNWHYHLRWEKRLRRSNLLADHTEKNITYKIATEQEELERSFELVWRCYTEVGLQAANTESIRLTKYHVLPNTKVFVAVDQPKLSGSSSYWGQYAEPGKIVGTLTMVEDSLLGLPVEEVCGEGVQRLRRRGGNVAEIMALAVNPEYRNRNIMMSLFRLMMAHANRTEVSDLVCSVTKRHIPFYRSMLLFEPVGELRPYSAANGIEVQCHHLNIARSRKVARDRYHDPRFDADIYRFFFAQESFSYRRLDKDSRWNEKTLRYFLTERTRLLDTFDDNVLYTLRRIYSEQGLTFPL
jgi:ribosomal protein S18 acetylase RimI-like enzyme